MAQLRRVVHIDADRRQDFRFTVFGIVQLVLEFGEQVAGKHCREIIKAFRARKVIERALIARNNVQFTGRYDSHRLFERHKSIYVCAVRGVIHRVVNVGVMLFGVNAKMADKAVE